MKTFATVLAAFCLATLPALSGSEEEFIRVAADHWGFETSTSKTPFIPFGVNFVLNDKRFLNVFGPGVYDRERYERALAALAKLEFNTVKVFLPIAQVLPDPQVPGEARIAPGYLDNLDGLPAVGPTPPYPGGRLPGLLGRERHQVVARGRGVFRAQSLANRSGH